MWTAFLAMFALAAAPDAGVDVGDIGVVAEAEARLAAGAVTEAVGLLLHHARAGELQGEQRTRAAQVLARAAGALAGQGEAKAAAVAADAAWTLDPDQADRKGLSNLVLRWATELVDDDDEAGARALADRAVAIDGENAEARALAADLAGMDTWVPGHLTLGAGVALWITTATAFVVGSDRERLARRGGHDDATLDALALQQNIATAIAWSAAAGAAISTGLGLALVFAHDPGPAPIWPHPFPAIPSPPAP